MKIAITIRMYWLGVLFFKNTFNSLMPKQKIMLTTAQVTENNPTLNLDYIFFMVNILL